MSAQWGYRIPVLVFVLGACSVYDASLLTTTGPLGGAGGSAAGQSGSEAGSGGLPAAHAGTGGSDAEPEAGAAGNADGGAAPNGGGGGSGTGGNGAAGSGGSIAGGGSSAGSGGAAVPLELELIDDMENKDSVIDATNGRGGDWYAANDATVGGTQAPTPFVVTALLATDPRYSKGSRYASMTAGMGFTNWGENLGFNLKLLSGNKHPSYDASAYCGVHFFGKTAAGASTKALLRVIDKNSHPDGGVCGLGGMPCYQYFQKVLTFSTDWEEKSVLFSELTCSGWPPALVLKEIFSVEFGLTANSKFELWVDDIAFLKKPASGVCPK